MTLLNDHTFLAAFPFLNLRFQETGLIDSEEVEFEVKTRKNNVIYDDQGNEVLAGGKKSNPKLLVSSLPRGSIHPEELYGSDKLKQKSTLKEQETFVKNLKEKTEKGKKKLEDRQILKGVFWKIDVLYKNISQIIFQYLISHREIDNKVLETEELKSALNHIFTYIAEVEADPFATSLETVKHEIFDYYVNHSESKRMLIKDCDTIRDMLFNLMSDVASGQYGIYNNEIDFKEGICAQNSDVNICFSNDKKFQEKLVQICKSIDNCMQKQDIELVNYKLRLTENNVPTML